MNEVSRQAITRECIVKVLVIDVQVIVNVRHDIFRSRENFLLHRRTDHPPHCHPHSCGFHHPSSGTSAITASKSVLSPGGSRVLSFESDPTHPRTVVGEQIKNEPFSTKLTLRLHSCRGHDTRYPDVVIAPCEEVPILESVEGSSLAHLKKLHQVLKPSSSSCPSEPCQID